MTGNRLLLLASLTLASCSAPQSKGASGEVDSQVQIATLYRNGSLMPEVRIHFGSFDAEGEVNDFNINNCEMTARLLNANVREQMGSDEQSVGFWCEPGHYREEGLARDNFDAEFPTDVTGNAAP
jgi:hypothetical protein